ncbi:M23 family metallopeptidase [Mycolicibacterium sediminis]|uniref:Peptidase M23 n=1 Tax=Mycolicibacterium sediminis TaxID=1286180 RepID=A0A7I7QMD3_9MYCO|nr:M23 family metallopeptidase [Mycolicibacterium sediminis]BBY27405.1 peptidase M23 [Mycolicibacterium sediminis]
MRAPLPGIVAVVATVAMLAACSGSSESSSASDESTTSTTAPAAADAGPVAPTPVLASVLSAPVPVPTTDGKVHLAYELSLTNSMGQDVDLESVAVRAGDRTLLTLSGDRLAYWTRILGAGDVPTTRLGPAQAATVWLDVVVDGAQGSTPAVPQELSHMVAVKLSKPMPPLLPATMTEDVATVAVSTHAPPVIAPPLNGPGWLDGNSCCDMTAHRMALNPLNGSLYAAERFAIDYVQLSADGTVFRGPKDRTESYPYFGADIHAVADGPVVSVLDGLPEQTPGESPSGLRLEEYGGNHVVQDIGDGNYAFYAHMKTGSVRVRPGDQLTTGQVVGNLGNSGNTDAPHLHFHVMNGPDPLMSDGLPFVFRSFELESRLATMDALGPLLDGTPAPLQPGVTARTETDTSPLVLDVMRYDVG